MCFKYLSFWFIFILFTLSSCEYVDSSNNIIMLNDAMILRQKGLCFNEPCISKCCPNKRHYSGGKCIPLHHDIIVEEKLKVYYKNNFRNIVNISQMFTILPGLTCNKRYRESSPFYLQEVSITLLLF